MENIFLNPTKYINEIYTNKLMNESKMEKYNGKSIAVMFLTKYCNAKCPFCMYKSPMKEKSELANRYELDENGIKNSIEFINKANIGYLLISGGGEPFLKTKEIYEMIKNSKVNKIVIATNGYWAKNHDNALKIIKALKEAQNQNSNDVQIIIRISIDKWHGEQLGIEHVKNAIDIFKEKYNGDKSFKLKIHTIMKDSTIYEILDDFNNYSVNHKNEYSSDNKTLNKSSKKRTEILFDDGYLLEIEYAKLFYPNLEVDIRKDLTGQMKTFEEDLTSSQYGNFSIVNNSDNTKGLDFLINYNGNISTWGNYQINNIANIYMDNHENVLNKLYGDIISYSFLNKEFKYIANIVKEVSLTSVKRAIGINIRDYSGMYLLFENKLQLYYAVRIIQEYIKASKIDNLNNLSEELKETISKSIDEIQELYYASNYTIINQYKERQFVEEEWSDLFFLIKMGHFDVTDVQKNEALKYFNSMTNSKYKDIDEIINDFKKDRYARLVKRFNV